MSFRHAPSLPAAPQDLAVDLGRMRAQKPYRNGVTVHTSGGWLGNGFGSETTKVAVDKDGQVVAVYSSGNTHLVAQVLDRGISSDRARDPRGGTYVTRSAFLKWIEAVKAL